MGSVAETRTRFPTHSPQPNCRCCLLHPAQWQIQHCSHCRQSCLWPTSSLLFLGQLALNLAEREIAKDCAKLTTGTKYNTWESWTKITQNSWGENGFTQKRPGVHGAPGNPAPRREVAAKCRVSERLHPPLHILVTAGLLKTSPGSWGEGGASACCVLTTQVKQ